MNRKIVNELKRERRRLYPCGLPLQTRGSGKTMLELSHMLRYLSYQIAIDACKSSERKMTMGEARIIMSNYIEEMWPFQ